MGAASLARLLGVAQVPDDREVSGAVPRDEKLDATDVRFSYVDGRDVLHGVDLDVGVGERIAMVGPSGAGKSTLGRLLAGIHPPRTGAVTVGGVGLVELPLDDLRGHVALVTQEHHVFVGTIRENLALAIPPGGDSGDEAIRAALDAVDALVWVELLPEGLDTVVGSGGRTLTAAQAQQVALARLVLADPHTLVLDEATSLIDPRAARHLERSLAVVLEGRTVIAIAHRLFSAHDADRVAVVEDGVISEFGSHDDLVAADGSYAALWRSWNGQSAATDADVLRGGARTMASRTVRMPPLGGRVEREPRRAGPRVHGLGPRPAHRLRAVQSGVPARLHHEARVRGAGWLRQEDGATDVGPRAGVVDRDRVTGRGEHDDRRDGGEADAAGGGRGPPPATGVRGERVAVLLAVHGVLLEVRGRLPRALLF